MTAAAVPDQLVRSLSADGGVSVRVLVSTALVREATSRHRTSPVASVALGRALSGGLLLATEGQGGERVQLQLRGEGPLGSITVTADSEGCVRGYVSHPDVDLPPLGAQLAIASALGLGVLSVERMHPSWKRPYNGVVPIVTGEIAQDLAHYLLESEQKPSAVALGIYLAPGGNVDAACGYLVQGLPGADERVLAELEHRVAQTPNPSELVHAGAGAEAILEQLLGDIGCGAVESLTPRFACSCSMERVRRAATLLGRDEIRELVRTGEVLEVRCEWCTEVYRLSPDSVASALPDA